MLLEAAKLSSYAGFESLAALLFALLTASWAALRLWALPSRIVRSVAVDAPRVLGGFPFGSRPLAAALLVLWVLHCYWFALIVRVAWLQLTSGRLRDAREEEEVVVEEGEEGKEEKEKDKGRKRNGKAAAASSTPAVTNAAASNPASRRRPAAATAPAATPAPAAAAATRRSRRK